MSRVGLQLITLALAAAALTSCGDDDRRDFYNGTGLLNVAVEPVAPLFANVELPTEESFSLSMTSAEGNSHTWASISDFDQGARYISGPYILTASSGSLDTEGFDIPYYTTTSTINLIEGQRNSIIMMPHMYSTMVKANRSESFDKHFSTLYFHSLNGSYIGFEASEKRIAYLRPGAIYIAAEMRDTDTDLTLMLATDVQCQSASLSSFSFDFEETTNSVIITRRIDNGESLEVASFVLTREMLESEGPTVTVDATSLTLPELTSPASPALFNVDCPTPLSRVILTIVSSSESLGPICGEVDLVNPTEAQKKFLDNAGIKPISDARHFSVDVSPLIELLTYTPGTSNTTTFTLEIIDTMMHINRPVSLSVNTLPVSMRVVKVSPVVLGLNTAEAIIEAPDADPMKYLTVTGRSGQEPEQQLEIRSLVADEIPGRWIATIAVPPGVEPVTLSFFYNNSLKETVTVNRIAPEYTIAIDAFATQVRIKIAPTDNLLRKTLVERMTFFINGTRVPAYTRDTETGIVTIIGLTPSTAYTLETGINDTPSSSTVTFVTEPVEALPNGDFEDTKHTIDYKDLLSGGLYSQTFAEIFNNQNRTSVSVFTPSEWANTNSKTFCESSKNKNTWYMQPSVMTTRDAMSGDFAVELRSVGFDPDGAAIPPYLQESRPFVNYSRNIPDIKYRAAGRLLLGSYLFNPLTAAETYAEGIPFASRPLSLGGFYRYTPSTADIGDRGAITIELLDASGRIIGHGKTQLTLATSYTAFNIPVNYTVFGAKAFKLRVMVSSSDVEASIATETSSVITYSDPSTSSSTGSVLTVDNFTLAY